MSKIIYIGNRVKYQPPQVVRPTVRTVTLPYDDDHYLFPGIMRAYLTVNANKYLFGLLAIALLNKATDDYYDISTRFLVVCDRNARRFRWYVLPVLEKIATKARKTAIRAVRKALRPVIEAWKWREEIYRD